MNRVTPQYQDEIMNGMFALLYCLVDVFSQARAFLSTRAYLKLQPFLSQEGQPVNTFGFSLVLKYTFETNLSCYSLVKLKWICMYLAILFNMQTFSSNVDVRLRSPALLPQYLSVNMK